MYISLQKIKIKSNYLTSFTLGLIVEEIVIFLIYSPFTVAGFFDLINEISVSILFFNLEGIKK